MIDSKNCTKSGCDLENQFNTILVPWTSKQRNPLAVNLVDDLIFLCLFAFYLVYRHKQIFDWFMIRVFFQFFTDRICYDHVRAPI